MFAQNTSFQWTEESGKRCFCGFLSADSFFTAVVQFTPGSLGYPSRGRTQHVLCECKSVCVDWQEGLFQPEHIPYVSCPSFPLLKVLIRTDVLHAWKDQLPRPPGRAQDLPHAVQSQQETSVCSGLGTSAPGMLGLSLNGSYWFGIHLCIATDFQKSHSYLWDFCSSFKMVKIGQDIDWCTW